MNCGDSSFYVRVLVFLSPRKEAGEHTSRHRRPRAWGLRAGCARPALPAASRAQRGHSPPYRPPASVPVLTAAPANPEDVLRALRRSSAKSLEERREEGASGQQWGAAGPCSSAGAGGGSKAPPGVRRGRGASRRRHVVAQHVAAGCCCCPEQNAVGIAVAPIQWDLYESTEIPSSSWRYQRSIFEWAVLWAGSLCSHLKKAFGRAATSVESPDLNGVKPGWSLEEEEFERWMSWNEHSWVRNTAQCSQLKSYSFLPLC